MELIKKLLKNKKQEKPIWKNAEKLLIFFCNAIEKIKAQLKKKPIEEKWLMKKKKADWEKERPIEKKKRKAAWKNRKPIEKNKKSIEEKKRTG